MNINALQVSPVANNHSTKMGLEVNKLFYCIPLKVGLLSYGYLSLPIVRVEKDRPVACKRQEYRVQKTVLHGASLELGTIIKICFQYTSSAEGLYSSNQWDVIPDIMLFFMYVVEMVFITVFISGMHMNQPKSIKIVFWYKIVSSLVFVGLDIMEMYSVATVDHTREWIFGDVESYESQHHNNELSNLIILFITILVISTALLFYMLVAVRSYYIKLERDISRHAEDLYRSARNLLPAGKTLNDDFEEFTNETFKTKSLGL